MIYHICHLYSSIWPHNDKKTHLFLGIFRYSWLYFRVCYFLISVITHAALLQTHETLSCFMTGYMWLCSGLNDYCRKAQLSNLILVKLDQILCRIYLLVSRLMSFRLLSLNSLWSTTLPDGLTPCLSRAVWLDWDQGQPPRSTGNKIRISRWFTDWSPSSKLLIVISSVVMLGYCIAQGHSDRRRGSNHQPKRSVDDVLIHEYTEKKFLLELKYFRLQILNLPTQFFYTTQVH